MRIQLLFFWLFIGFGQSGIAQNFIIKEYNTKNGLVSARNDKTIQCSDNFYYTCSFGSLLRFDGHSFRSFTNADGLANYRVTDIAQTHKGQFLICNYYNIMHFDGRKIWPFKSRLPSNTIFEKTIKLSNGKLLVMSSLGAYEIGKNDSLNPFFLQANKPINDLLEYQPGQYITYNLAENILSFKQNNRGNWQQIQLPVGMGLAGFLSYKNSPLIKSNLGLFGIQNGKLVLFRPNNFAGKLPINRLFVDSKNREWYSDANNQLWLKAAGQYQNLNEKYKLSPHKTMDFFEDKNHNIVLTSEPSLRIFKERFFEEINLPHSAINGYFLGKYNTDTAFVGLSAKGLVLISKGRQVIKPLDTRNVPFKLPYLNGRFMRSLAYPEGVLHLFRTGFYKIVNNKLEPYSRTKIDMDALLRGFYDSQAECFFAGGNNILYRIKKDKIDSLNFGNIAKGLGPHSYVKLPTGALLFVASHKKLIKHEAGKLTDITSQMGIGGKDFDIYWHKNRLWTIVLGIGIREYEVADGQLKLLRSISKENGLLDANIGRFEIDDKNNLWLNCFSGLYFLHIDAQGNIHSKKIPLSADGMDSPMIENIFYDNKHVYAAGVNTVFDIYTNSNMLDIKPIASYFSSIKVNGSEVLGQKNLLQNGSSEATFPADSNNISFTANTIYYGYDDAIQYQYMLDDADQTWKNLAQGSTINYNALANGSYVFKLRSVNNFGKSNFTEALFPFVIKPPFFKTWWFRMLLGILATAAIYIFIRQRDAQKHHRNQMALQVSNLKLTALQSQMNPHFIFNSLNSIQNYILQQKPIEAARYLSKFSKLMRRILDQSFSNLSPLADIVDTLNMYLELEAFRFSNEFSYQIKFEKEAQRTEIQLPPLLLQPYVENAIIHGLMPKEGQKNLLIHLYCQNNTLHCSIEDNGVGRGNKLDKNTSHISRGQKLTTDMLATMKTLINADASIEITDKKDENNQPLGTKIDLIIPLNQAQI